MRLRPLFAVLALLLVGTAGLARASNGPILSTVGPKGPVTTPVDGDGWSMFRMPSSIGWNWDHEVDLDMFVFFSRTKLRNTQNNLNAEGSTFGATGGVVFAPGRIDDDASDEEWDAYLEEGGANKITFGFGVYVDMAGGTGGSTKVRWTTYPETIPQRAGIQFVTPTLVVAYTPTKWLSLGLGLHAILGQVEIRTVVGGGTTPLNGSPQISGVPIPGNPTYADFLDIFSNDQSSDPTTYFKSDLSAVQYSATLSASFRPHEKIGIGFSYRFRSWAPNDLEGDGLVDSGRTFSQALGGLSPAIQNVFLATLPDAGTNGFAGEYEIKMRSIYVPRQVRMSVAVWPIERLMIGAEVAWVEWHRAFRRFNLSLQKGSNRDVNFVVGSNRIDTTLKQRWYNRWIYSLYTAYGVTDSLTLRAGINFSEIAVNEDVANNSPNAAFVNTNLNFGASYSISRFTIHGMVEHGFHASKRSNDRPESLTGKNTYYAARQWFVHLGLSVRF